MSLEHISLKKSFTFRDKGKRRTVEAVRGIDLAVNHNPDNLHGKGTENTPGVFAFSKLAVH